MGNSFIQPALEYARAFYCVCPIRGKAPVHIGGNGWKDASRHEPEVEWLFKHRPGWRHTGLGIATGEGSGAWVLDVDGHDGRVSLAILIREHGPLPGGPVTITGNGFHHWFAYTPECEPMRNRVAFLPGLDVRTNGGGVVIPPSPHPDGGFYRWRDVGLLDMEPPQAPEWLLKTIIGEQPPETPNATQDAPTASPVASNRYAEGALRSAEDRIASAGNGEQRRTLYSEALSIGKRIVAPGLVSAGEAMDRLTAAGLRMANHRKHRWVQPAIERVVSDGLSAGVGRVSDAA